MDEGHVPSIGLRYWAIFVVTSVFGAHMGDVVAAALTFGVLGQMLVVAAVLTVIFIAERFDKSATDAWYWIAVIVIQIAAVRLGDFSTIRLGINRLELVGGLAVLLVTVFLVARSDETRLFSTLQMERPGTAAKPMADVAHWLGMVVASTLGAVAADLFAITFGVGTVYSAVIFSVIVVVLLQLQRRSRPNRLHAFWLTTSVVRADGVAIGDLLVKGPHVHLGLTISTLLTGGLVLVLIIFWRGPKSSF